jgi:hypothetical protein
VDDPEFAAFLSRPYLAALAAVLFGRAADFFSTWVATPRLVLEGNPIAKWMGWRLGILINLALCLILAHSPMVAVILTTMSLLVAARNFQGAWMMKSLGEEAYQDLTGSLLARTGTGPYLFTTYAQAVLTVLIGIALVAFSSEMIPFSIGLGVIAYSIAVAFYSTLGVGRRRRAVVVDEWGIHR